MPDPSPQQALLDQLQTWRYNRTLYPGWLIAPEQVRERLWRQTQGWIPAIVQQLAALNIQQQLEALFELNWRLEAAFIPIWNNLIPAYKQVHEAINPFPKDISDLPSATIVLSDATSSEVDWSAVRERWLAVTFGLLRYYREERQAEAFEALHARLGQISNMDGDSKARWCYERCLFAFGEMDDASAFDATGRWPQYTRDPFWSVRRAAVLAELGRTEQALEATEATLARLRDGLSDIAEHIPGLSREGWAMWLAMGLRSNQRWRAGLWDDSRARAHSWVIWRTCARG